MRTIATITKDRAEYYENDESVIDSDEVDYYLNGEKNNSLTKSRWMGQAATSLGLNGVLTDKEFKSMMRGINPKTGIRLRGQAQTGKERLAYDVTLSAPKSVSMALHIGGDSRVFIAHSRAVDATLKELEQRYANARRRINGARIVEDTGNLAIGVINHHTSRELDCQVHSHCVIMNATQRRDGSWVSLSHEDVASADWVGHYYRHKLREELHAIGYDTYKTKDAFELRGVSRSEVETFSKRTMVATEKVQAEGK